MYISSDIFSNEWEAGILKNNEEMTKNGATNKQIPTVSLIKVLSGSQQFGLTVGAASVLSSAHSAPAIT